MDSQSILNKLKEYRNDAYFFVTDALKVDSVTKQQKIALDSLSRLCNLKIRMANKEVLSDEDREFAMKTGLSIMSARGCGKDGFAAWAILWFTVCFAKCKNMATAPTEHQLKDVLWSEIAKWLSHAKRNGNQWINEEIIMQSDKVYLRQPEENENGKRAFTVCRTASARATKEEMAETLSGFHEKFMLFVIDEASGVADAIIKPLEGTLTGVCNIIISLFNPTRTSGFALKNHTEFSKFWVTLDWSAIDCEIVPRSKIEYARAKYGEDSDVYRVDILGMPPSQEEGTLIPYEWAKMAVNRDVEADEEDVHLGADIGRSGDPSDICIRKGMKVLPFWEFQIADTMQITGQISSKIDEYKPATSNIDALGLGWGVCDRLRERGYRVKMVNVAESASMNQKFYRLRDEIGWTVREWFEKKLISIPDDNELIDQISSIRYKIDSSGKIKIESKHEMKARGRKSPNKFDALGLTAVGRAKYREEKKKVDPWDDAFREAKEKSSERSWMVA